MQKVKSWNFGFVSIIKSVLVGVVATLVGIVVLAIVLKFSDLPSNVVNYVNDVIKGISIFVIVLLVKRTSTDKLLIRAIIAGVLYAVLSFVIFSIINGGVVFNMSVLFDLLFAVAVAVISAVILNLFSRKNG